MKVLALTDDEYWNSSPLDLAPIVDRTTSRRAAMFRLGEEGEDAPLAEVLEMPPWYVIIRHAHLCHRFEVVTKGSMYVDGRIIGPGDVMIAGPGEFYGPKVAGPDGCIAVEFFAKPEGIAGPIIYELPDGSTTSVNYMIGEQRPEDSRVIKAAQDEAVEAYRAAGL